MPTKKYEDCAGPFNDTYNLVFGTQYFYFEKYRPHQMKKKPQFFYSREFVPKNRTILFCGEVIISYNISTDCLQPNCMHT